MVLQAYSEALILPALPAEVLMASLRQGQQPGQRNTHEPVGDFLGSNGSRFTFNGSYQCPVNRGASVAITHSSHASFVSSWERFQIPERCPWAAPPYLWLFQSLHRIICL